MPEKPAFRSSRMHLYAGVLVVAGIIAFANSLPNRALFDHVPNAVVDPVLDNSIVRGGGLFGKIFGGEFLLSTYGRYRPVGYACLSAVVTSIGRHSYVSWRVLMVGLHLVTGVLVVGVFGGFVVGGVVSVGLLVARRVGRRDAVPFGPSMVIGAGIALAWGRAIGDWYLRG